MSRLLAVLIGIGLLLPALLAEEGLWPVLF